VEKTILSFYCDDTNPYCAPPAAFKTFLDFTASEGIAGESSVIFGYAWQEHGLMNRPANQAQSAYLEQVQRAFSCGIDSQFELMTHNGLYDFTQGKIPAGAIHEGLWLFEPAVTIAEYETYFNNIIDEGERLGIRFTGLTQPGCGCEACTRRYQELHTAGLTEPNPNVWQALINLAKAGKFRGPTVPCFFGGAVEQGSARLMASDGLYGVYDLPPNTTDSLGLWLNSSDNVDVDYYITANGQSGRIVELVRTRAPYCLFYAHWQGLNPANGVGWNAFTQMVKRVQKYLHQDITWMRPSEYTDRLRSNRP
jgi:hypothetical protein